MKIHRALLSVHDKTGVVELAKTLANLGVELISTGGTAKLLRGAGLPVKEVSELTGFPEMLDGRVKTLHPAVHGGILARRDQAAHMAALAGHGIAPIDLVVINLYLFEQVAAKAGATLEEAIENIDIGGPAMIRSAAKNWESVGVVVDPSQYAVFLEELTIAGGSLSRATRFRLAQEAFRRTAQYDAAIAAYLRSPGAVPRAGAATEPPLFPPILRLEVEQVQPLRYGENPHQQAAFYRLAGQPVPWRLPVGPELSYNNLLDFTAGLGLLREFDDPAAVVIKHTNPCGVGLAATVLEAFLKAKASDPVSIYGGIVGVNRPVDLQLVEALSGILLEILFAPSYTPEALEEIKRTKKRLRVLEVMLDHPVPQRTFRSVSGGLLVQEPDSVDLDPATLRVVTKRAPSESELQALRFAWRVVKHVKSNAIILTTRDQLIGVGAGQMSRVDAAKLAVQRARDLGLSPKGTVCASDAFFPFRDGLDVVAEAGATACIQPGGSLRDPEVIAAADQQGMAMVFTGIRHFTH